MDINLHSLLPDDISDEAAYHLVNFFVELTSALEAHYFAQMKRYIDTNTSQHLPDQSE
jgi:hypothetical protein